MAEVREQDVINALRSVAGPDRKGDIVGQGMVSGLAIKGGHVVFAIQIEPAQAAALEPMRKQAEAAVQALPGVLTVQAVLTAQKAASAPPTHQPGGHHHHAPSGHSAMLPEVREVIAVASGKGGVGKSTTAINLALALKQMGLSVGLLDADVYGPSVPRLAGVRDAKPKSPDGNKILPVEGFGLKLMSMGFLVEEDAPLVWRGPMVMGALEQLVRDVEWGALDVLVIDLPPGTGDVQLTLCQRVGLSGAVIVSTPQDIALLDARKGLVMFQKVEVPVLGIVENMSTYVCPNCGHEEHIFGHGGAEAEAQQLGVPFLGAIPLDRSIRETSDAGTPIVFKDPDGAHAKAYRKVAEQVWATVTADQAEGPKIVID